MSFQTLKTLVSSQVQKRNKDIGKIVHVTSVVQL